MIPHLSGKTRKLLLPNGEEHKAVYAIVDLSEILASHNEETFANTVGYPTDSTGHNINDRNYKDDVAAQQNVEKIAKELNPEGLISLTSTPAGTPVINADGIVVSGNNRVMSLKLAVKKYPENYEAYKKQLAEDVDVFGFGGNVGTALLMNDTIPLPGSSYNDPQRIKFTHPVLVRIDENLPSVQKISKTEEIPFTHYLDKAKKMINDGTIQVKYSKITSGASKGEYHAEMINDEKEFPGIEYWNRNATSGSLEVTKEKALQNLEWKFANYLNKKEGDTTTKEIPSKDYLTTEDLAKFNQDSKKGERPVDKAVKLSNILINNTRCKDLVLTIIDGYDTFSDLYAPEARLDRKRLMDSFVSCGLIPEAQLPSYFEGTEFTEQGKDFVEMLLSAIILSPDALKVSNSEGVKRLRQIIIGSLPLLITNANLPGASLKDNISDAVIIQYKINQAGDFADFIRSQSLFEEDKPNVKSLYINSLLRTGRNVFKNAIRKYNDSVKSNAGTSLFGNAEQLTPEEIFTKAIIDNVDATDKKLIMAYSPSQKQEPMQESSTTMQEQEVEEIEAPIIEEKINTNFFTGDNWFAKHPEKILGEAYEASGRFGKVTKYKGTIEAINRINVPMDWVGNDRSLIDPLLSTGTEVNISGELEKPETKNFIEEIIKKADRQAGEKISRKLKQQQGTTVDEDAVETEVAQLQTFSETYRTYNEGITIEETEVFIWYKTQIGKPLSRQWINLVHPGEFTEHLTRTHPYHVDEMYLRSWVDRGLVYYYEGKLIPAPIYLSGNMWDKKTQLERDKDDIIKQYSQSVYDQQAAAFDKAWRRVYDRRLIISADEDSLVVLPISKLSNEFKIKRIAEMPEDGVFKVKKTTAASDKNYGQPNWAKDIAASSDRDREDFEELTLTEAFSYWMLRYRPKLNESISHYEIVKYYCYSSPIRVDADNDSKEAIAKAKAKREKLKSSTQLEGERLFKIFLHSQLEPNDKVRLESQWNANYNNYLEIDFTKIPIAFTYCRYYKGSHEELKWEKREAVAFLMNNGSGVLSYDVGVGKTPSAIFTMSAFLDAGYSKRPLLTVPNQVYKQFISEIKNFAPHIPVLEGYNLSDEYLQNFKDASGNIVPVPEGCITIITYEGLENIGFNQDTQNEMTSTLYEILNQGGESEREKSEKQKASFQEKIEGLVGKGLSGTMTNIEDFGFDFMCYDEAHKMKKVFTAVKGEVTEDDKGKQTRGKNPYVINSGVPSAIGLKGFMLNYYIQSRNKGQNIMLLTATPFTNSPLEIFSMLSMVGYDQLKNTDLNNIKNFFDTYVKTSIELVINSRLKPQFKQVILGFNNLISLQTLIRRYINYKTGEDVNVPRPKKYVLPYLSKLEDGIVTILSDKDKIETYISMTPLQEMFMEQVIEYVEGKSIIINEGTDDGDEDEDKMRDNEAFELDESSLDANEKLGVKIIKGLTWSRNLALSPHLYVNSGLGKPTYRKYVEMSPKLHYIMKCIKSVKEYHESKGEPVSGQVIYMDRGIEYFPLLKEYLIKEVGFMEHEVGIIQSGLPKNGKRSKEYIKNLYNGEIYNEATKMYESVSDADRIKVIIGSSTIKEGINLQRYGTVLYNAFIDWNPTDIQQLEGRIWRQGNTFNSVRICNPLVIDSADIFLFQKLQEKTSRLNTIWSTDGKKNVLNTEEFNPAELKYALIRDPKVVAELKSIDEIKELEGKILGFNRDIETVDKLKEAVNEINSNFKAVKEFLNGYRKFESTGNKLQDAKELVSLTNDLLKKQTDMQGRELSSQYERNPEKYTYESPADYAKRSKKIKEGKFSDLNKVSKQYYFSDFAIAVRTVVRAEFELIKARNIENFSLEDTTGLDDFKKDTEKAIEQVEATKTNLTSKEHIALLIKEIIEERIANKIEYKPLEETVVDFCKLNYLLSDKKVKTSKVSKYTTCPPMEKDGTRAIDAEALSYLDSCIASAGQTKDLYFDISEGGYKPERKQVHKKIIDNLFKDVKCVAKGAPIAVFTGGSPASGKSTYIKKIADYLLTDDVFHLDADAIRAELPEYQGWNANATHKETQDIVNELLSRIGDGSCRYDFVYDGTMNKAQKYFTLINKVKELGYKTFIIFMDIPYGVARKRALNRYKTKGRYVPMEVIDDFFKVLPDHNGLTMGQFALDELKNIVDGYIVIDGITGQIISKGGEALPQERIYEGQARVDYQKFLSGESQVPKEEIEPVIPVVNKEGNQRVVDKKEIPVTKAQSYSDVIKAVRKTEDWEYTQQELIDRAVKSLREKEKADKQWVKDFSGNVAIRHRNAVKAAMKQNKFAAAVSDNILTADRVKKIIESAGLSTQPVTTIDQPVVKQSPTKEQLESTIKGLEFLAKRGNKNAEATIKGLKLLLLRKK